MKSTTRSGTASPAGNVNWNGCARSAGSHPINQIFETLRSPARPLAMRAKAGPGCFTTSPVPPKILRGNGAMTARRYFGEVVELVGVGAVIVRRDDGLGDVFTPAAEIGAGVPLHPGDRVEFSVLPFGAKVRGCDLILHAYTGD